jgi:hypothetical protein
MWQASPVADLKIPVTCANCKAEGYTIWSAESLDRAGWELVETSQGFHEERARTISGKSVIVCDACDEIQPH